MKSYNFEFIYLQIMCRLIRIWKPKWRFWEGVFRSCV